MKKFASLILALSLCMSLAATAFAVGETAVLKSEAKELELTIADAVPAGTVTFGGAYTANAYNVPFGAIATLTQTGEYPNWGVALDVYEAKIVDGKTDYLNCTYMGNSSADNGSGAWAMNDGVDTYLLSPSIQGNPVFEMYVVLYVTDDSQSEQPTTPTEPEEPAAPKPPAEPAFTDVPAGEYYAAPVAWAIEKGITNGTSETTFSPNNTCSTAHILTFLYRSQGSPEAPVDNPFFDVKHNDYFHDAALWAHSKSLVADGAFGGDIPCTRSAVVTYLWKLAGSPEMDAADFTDVAADAEYAQAVAWAVKNGVTNGTSDTTFSPDSICTRGQIVTFLHRAYAE